MEREEDSLGQTPKLRSISLSLTLLALEGLFLKSQAPVSS